MDRRKFLLGLFSTAATIAVVKPDKALAQAVECYDAYGNLVQCPAHGYPLPYGVVRRARRRRRVRRRVRRVVHHRARRRVRRRIRRRF
ncbi:MAG: hypothetical protein GY742_19650 [Hyphomicrobiales bacterium]|nr:hypothetical protein [Hyphomicrobiales bacterium]